MRYLVMILFVLSPSIADAGILFGDRVTIHNYGGASSGYSVRYGRSYSYGPTYRTYRTYRAAPVVTYSAPAVGYYVPPPAQVQVQAAPAPVAAPADPAPEPAPVVQSYSVQTYSVPAYSVRSYSSPSYFAADDDADIVRVRHKEKHRRGKHKVKHSETIR